MPCTIANTAIALVLAGIVAAVVATYQTTAVGLAAGGVVFALCAAAIALRGYLVPYTPYITKTYFPDRVLRYFEKEPVTVRDESGIAADEDIAEEDDQERFKHVGADDVEEILEAADALEPCENVDDLCVTASFRDTWRDHIHEFREGDGARRHLASMVDADPGDVSINQRESVVTAKNGRRRLGRWESEAAYVADMAAARALEEHYAEWDQLIMREKSAVLNGIRVFLEQCPLCDGVVSVGEEHVETCCREYDIMAVRCEDCGASLFESGHEAPETPPY